MALFQAKIGLKMTRKKIKIIGSFHSFTTHNRKFQKNSKKIQKKLKNTIMASFHAKTSWKRPKRRESKNYRPVPFLPDTK